ncbi:uncharacterized protein MYCFIDRAFT_191140 [Pseudocercospora fijiensis CIRAD86]|uniref:Uncharacterized protein n=1 Tax=Pseudocercospora fijiensis (strain CIRAD86) TaxID=383855 RepID=M2YJ16_PSEFD|nr:uncharacterized protein MYCFIDRAFT_191140 [Pseudocercospora fijiensis CIRAD86]EME77725.1 hypothetical protein MYCFIDRAFT_191140 [Pseudocercospora fijiensis CIRAD86]
MVFKSGIGIDLAKHLHSKGWKVALVGRNKEAGLRIVSEIEDPKNARFFQTDVASYDSQASMFFIYIYSHRDKAVEDIPPGPDLSCTDINYKGVIYGVQLATHFMRNNQPQAGGKIIVNGSIGGIFPHRVFPEYCGTKAGVIQFVRGVAPLLKAKENILINTVLSGAVATPIVPQGLMDAISEECLTPVSTVLEAHDKFIDDDTGVIGKALEASAKDLIFYEAPEYGNGYKTKRAVPVWEPHFRAMHGEDSKLDDAVA